MSIFEEYGAFIFWGKQEKIYQIADFVYPAC